MTRAVQRTIGAPVRFEGRGGLGMLPLLFAPLVGALLLALVFGRLLEPGGAAAERRPLPPVSLHAVEPVAR